MYAVIETGGKQYRVEVGTELEVELLDVEPGKTITIDRVLLVADGDVATIGQPLVTDAEVSAEVLRQDRGPKLISFKYRPKARSRVKKGHRQDLTVLRISDIMLAGKSAAGTARKAKDDAKTERERLAEAADVQAARDAKLAAKLAVGTGVPAPKAGATSKKAAAPKRTVKAGATAVKADAAATKPAAKPAARGTVTKPAMKKAAAKAAPKTIKPAKTTKPAKADAPKTKAAAPKRTRATKKDE